MKAMIGCPSTIMRTSSMLLFSAMLMKPEPMLMLQPTVAFTFTINAKSPLNSPPRNSNLPHWRLNRGQNCLVAGGSISSSCLHARRRRKGSSPTPPVFAHAHGMAAKKNGKGSNSRSIHSSSENLVRRLPSNSTMCTATAASTAGEATKLREKSRSTYWNDNDCEETVHRHQHHTSKVDLHLWEELLRQTPGQCSDGLVNDHRQATFAASSSKNFVAKPPLRRYAQPNGNVGRHTEQYGFDPLNLASESTSFSRHGREVQSRLVSPPLSSNGAKDHKSGDALRAVTPSKVGEGDPLDLMSDLWKARFLLLGAAALYGTNFALVKILGSELPVGASTSLRFGLASLATLPWMFSSPSSDDCAASSPGAHMHKSSEAVASVTKKGHDDASSPLEGIRSWWKDHNAKVERIMPSLVDGLEVGVWTSIGYIAQAIGLQTTDASKSAFICSLAVVIVPLLDALTGKQIKPRAVVGVLCAIVGVALLELPPEVLSSATTASPTDFTLTTGDMFTFLQPLAFGMGFWRMEAAMQKHPTEAARLTSAQLFSVAFFSVINCWLGLGGSGPPPSWAELWGWVSDPMILMALVWTGVVTTALTVYMETLALKTVSAAEATLIFSTEPIWGAGFASAVVGETLGTSALAGAALILSGCAVSTAEDNEEDDRQTSQQEEGESKGRPGNNILKPSICGGVTVAAQAGVVAKLQEGVELAVKDESGLL